MINSIAMAERIGPEAMHALLNHFFKLALEAIYRYEGTINQFLSTDSTALPGARGRGRPSRWKA